MFDFFEPTLAADLLRFMNHHDFAFDETFGESAGNAEVYDGTARQLVLDCLRGRSGTVMMLLGGT